MPTVSLSVLSKHTTPEGVLSLCGCSLPLTLTTSIGIWYSAGATTSWSTAVSMSCSSRISLCIRSNYDSWWLNYSSDSFQLLSSQYSVHHSYPPRNHQCCYQETFISSSDWRQARIRRLIFCCHLSKACAFVAIENAPNRLIIEIGRPRCFGKIAKLSS